MNANTIFVFGLCNVIHAIFPSHITHLLRIEIENNPWRVPFFSDAMKQHGVILFFMKQIVEN